MKLSAGDWKFTYQPGSPRASAKACARSAASASSASKSRTHQMSGWSGVVPPARYLLILRTVSFRFSRVVPTRRLSAMRVPSITDVSFPLSVPSAHDDDNDDQRREHEPDPHHHRSLQTRYAR